MGADAPVVRDDGIILKYLISTWMGAETPIVRDVD